MGKERGREKFSRYKNLIIFVTKVCTLLPLKVRQDLFNSCRNINGITGIGLRYVLIKSIAKKCGENVSIQPGVYLFYPENLIIGNHVSIHPMCYIDAAGGIEIGNDVSIAHGVTIMSTTHNYESNQDFIKNQGIKYYKTEIKNNVWIGAKCVILAGVTIGEDSVVGASSVVTKSTEKLSVMVGNPAKLLKKR